MRLCLNFRGEIIAYLSYSRPVCQAPGYAQGGVGRLTIIVAWISMGLLTFPYTEGVLL